MKIVRNNLIPFKGYKAIYLFGLLFVRKDCTMSDIDLNHERIHSTQAKELFFIFFYLWYLVEWLIRLCMPGNAYRSISFEREAYRNERDLSYLKNRKTFKYNFLKYMKDEKH